MAPSPVPVTGKRKRGHVDDIATPPTTSTLQIITGSYERVLHGLTASISHPHSSVDAQGLAVTFSDQFLFNAHASSIRCLALSPPTDAAPPLASKRILATGGMDECINLYSLSTSAPLPSNPANPPSLLPLTASTDTSSRNRELGALMHHSATVSALHFPSRSKLLSASYDNTIAISRVRDWTVLSTIRAPVPKPVGRPSGDTAGPGEVPAGINDVAVHPSAKLCLSVGQGERSMRLWNLVTGKKAGVLTFEKPILSLLGEGRWRGGEGRSVVWRNNGEEFAVGFERGAVVYGLDCQVKAVARITGTKVCQVNYFALPRLSTTKGAGSTAMNEREPSILAISTEDGRIVFFDTDAVHSTSSPDPEDLLLKPVGQLGSIRRGYRIKAFQMFDYVTMGDNAGSAETKGIIVVATGSSDGDVCIWSFDISELTSASKALPSSVGSREESTPRHSINGPKREKDAEASSGKESDKDNESAKQIGVLIGTVQTGRRITCLTGFFMDTPIVAKANGSENKDTGDDEEAEEEWEGFDGAGDERVGETNDSFSSGD